MGFGQFYNILNIDIFHAFKMTARAFIVTDLAAGAAPEPVYLHYVEMLPELISIIGCHAKRWNGIAPDRYDGLFECGCNVHESCIMRDDQFRSADQVCRLIDAEFTAGIVDPYRINAGNLRSDFMILLATQ